MSVGGWIAIGVVVLMALALGNLVIRRRREAPTRSWISGQPVLFSTTALVRIRASGAEGRGWRALKSRAGTRLVVHSGGLEATGTANGFSSGTQMLSEGTTMWRDQVGWDGSPVGKSDCIRLHGSDGVRIRDWAVTPKDASVDELWDALDEAGVTPSPRPD